MQIWRSIFAKAFRCMVLQRYGFRISITSIQWPLAISTQAGRDWLLETMALISWEDVFVLCPPHLDFQVKSIVLAVPQIMAKSPPNTPETQEIATTQVTWVGWTILLHFRTFGGQFKISHTFLYMTFPIAWATCGVNNGNIPICYKLAPCIGCTCLCTLNTPDPPLPFSDMANIYTLSTRQLSYFILKTKVRHDGAPKWSGLGLEERARRKIFQKCLRARSFGPIPE